MTSIKDVKTRENKIEGKFQYLKNMTGNKSFDKKKYNRKLSSVKIPLNEIDISLTKIPKQRNLLGLWKGKV